MNRVGLNDVSIQFVNFLYLEKANLPLFFKRKITFPDLWALQLYRTEKGFIEFRTVLQELRELSGPQCGFRNEWREEHLSHWYAGTIRPPPKSLVCQSCESGLPW